MRHSWRWFGPVDRVSLSDARQAGAQAIVTALHHVPTGEVWQAQAIAQRQREVSHFKPGDPTGLAWEVVESLPVSEAIKTQSGEWKRHFANYRQSLENLAAAGIGVICYNFMPVLDWTRTDLAWRVAHGGTTMRFDLVDFAVFDIHLLARAGAAESYDADTVQVAKERFSAMDDQAKLALSLSINAGLPGEAASTSLDGLRDALAAYRGIDADRLRRHFVDFLAEVVPTAERLGLRLCCHPDDPPFPLMGLPRIMSTQADYDDILGKVDSPASGMTLCTGSLGARHDNDLPGMVKRFGPKIHFAHLRNVRKEGKTSPSSFYEDEHLSGDTDMVAVISALLDEEARRKQEGRADAAIPMRPDHGQDILDDCARGAQPGYPAIGRLKGLAELRGIEKALTARHAG